MNQLLSFSRCTARKICISRKRSIIQHGNL